MNADYRRTSIRLQGTAASLVVAAFALLAPTFASPDDEPSSPALREQVEVQLVQLDFLATDKSGRPVTDLRPDELTILEGGREQTIEFLEGFSGKVEALVGEVGERSRKKRSRKQRKQPLPPVPEEDPPRWFVLVLDGHNSGRGGLLRSLEAARRVAAEKIRDKDRVAVLVLDNGIEYVFNFTDPREKLDAVLGDRSLYGGAPTELHNEVDELRDYIELCARGEAPINCSTKFADQFAHRRDKMARDTYRALTALVAGLGAIPERKFVFFFSDGFLRDAGRVGQTAITSSLAREGVDPFRYSSAILTRDTSREEEDLLDAATQARVTFFAVDLKRSSVYDPTSADQDRQVHVSQVNEGEALRDAFTVSRSTLVEMAHATGGRPVLGGDIEQGLARMVDVSRGSYTVGYYPDRLWAASEYRKVKIKTSRKGVVVTSRRGYYPSQLTVEEIPTQLAVGEFIRRANLVAIPVMVQLPAQKLRFEPVKGEDDMLQAQVGLYVSLLDDAGDLVGDSYQLISVPIERDELVRQESERQDFRHTLVFVVDSPGQYHLNAIVADQGGWARGEATHAVAVPSASGADAN